MLTAPTPVGAGPIRSTGRILLAQAHDLGCRTLAGHDLVDEGRPLFHRAARLAPVSCNVVNAGHAALVANMAENVFDNPGRNAEFVMQGRRGEASKIVSRPRRHRLGYAGDLSRRRNSLVECRLRLRPAGVAGATATKNELASVVLTRGQYGERSRRQKDPMQSIGLGSLRGQDDLRRGKV